MLGWYIITFCKGRQLPNTDYRLLTSCSLKYSIIFYSYCLMICLIFMNDLYIRIILAYIHIIVEECLFRRIILSLLLVAPSRCSDNSVVPVLHTVGEYADIISHQYLYFVELRGILEVVHHIGY